MPHTARIPRARVIALHRPAPLRLASGWLEWLAVGVALALLLGGLLGR